jgi:uncharacterized membrane protein
MKQAQFTKLLAKFRPQALLRGLLLCLLVVGLTFAPNGDASAAMSGGRMGGGSFSRPSMSRPSMSRPIRPSRPYAAPVPVPYGGGFGGGFGFPFMMPFFGFGGGFGGLFTILIVIAVANFLVSSFRKLDQDGAPLANANLENLENPTVTVSAVSVGLLAGAKELQADLNKIAKSANTSTPAGLSLLLQETTLALLRHPEYWVYASSETQQTRLNAAEAQFNRLALTERSKVKQETLSNVGQDIKEKALTAPSTAGTLATLPDTSEYIVVTLITATEGKVDMPKPNSDTELRQILNQLGAVASDKLMALEVLWQPQAEEDTLSASDLVANFPNLRRL